MRDQRQEVKDEALRDMRMEARAQAGKLQACYYCRVGSVWARVRRDSDVRAHHARVWFALSEAVLQ